MGMGASIRYLHRLKKEEKGYQTNLVLMQNTGRALFQKARQLDTRSALLERLKIRDHIKATMFMLFFVSASNHTQKPKQTPSKVMAP